MGEKLNWNSGGLFCNYDMANEGGIQAAKWVIVAWLQSSRVSTSVTTILLSLLDIVVVESANWPTWWGGGVARDCPRGCKETLVLAQTCCKVVCTCRRARNSALLWTKCSKLMVWSNMFKSLVRYDGGVQGGMAQVVQCNDGSWGATHVAMDLRVDAIGKRSLRAQRSGSIGGAIGARAWGGLMHH